MTSCACKLAQECHEEDPDYNPLNPDENSPVHDKYQAAKELGEEWGCPNWKPVKQAGNHVSLPEHKLDALNASLEPPKNKKMLAVIKGFESFLKVPGEVRGQCFKTCPNFYQTKGSPLSQELAEVASHQSWFSKGQYSVVNPNPTKFDLEAQDSYVAGEVLVTVHNSKKMQKENEELRKQIESERKKKK